MIQPSHIIVPKREIILPPDVQKPLFPGRHIRSYDEQQAMPYINSYSVMPAGPITDFLDTFVEASPPVNLESHPPDIGTNWTLRAGLNSYIQVDPSGQATPTNVLTCRYESVPGPTGDCYVQCDLKYNVSGGGNARLYLRCQGTGDTDDQYFLIINSTNVRLFKRVSNSETQIGSSSTDIPTLGNTKTYRLTITGTDFEITVNGVSRITGTDNAITADGRAGIRYVGGGANNWAFANYSTVSL